MADVEVATILPKELRLDAPPTMPQARSYLFRQQSTLSSYNPGSTIQINIPRLQRSYLKKSSYLRFDLTTQLSASAVTAAAIDNASVNVALDTAGAYSFIDKLEVFDYLGSTVLESISGVNALMAGLIDIGSSEEINRFGSSEDIGLAADMTGGTNVYVSTVGNFSQDAEIVPSNTGKVLTKIIDTTTVPTNKIGTWTFKQTTANQFSIHLPSFLGFLTEKMVPLHNGFTIVITLAPLNTPVVLCGGNSDHGFVDITTVTNYETGTSLVVPWDPTFSAHTNITTPSTNSDWTLTYFNWVVSNVNFDMDILELGPVAESMLLSANQGMPMTIHTKSFRNYTGSVKSGSNETILNMNINVASLTNIIFGMRPNLYRDNLYYLSIGERVRNFLANWEFQYGSTVLPQSTGVQTMSTMLAPLPTTTITDLIPTTDAQKYNALKSRGQESYRLLLDSRNVGNQKSMTRFTFNNFNTDFSRGTNKTEVGGINLINQYVFHLNVSKLYLNDFISFPTSRFLGGLSLELMGSKSGSYISGLNTNGMNTSLRLSFHPSYYTLTEACQLDLWAEYDAFINISPGIATTVSF